LRKALHQRYEPPRYTCRHTWQSPQLPDSCSVEAEWVPPVLLKELQNRSGSSLIMHCFLQLFRQEALLRLPTSNQQSEEQEEQHADYAQR
jgi:hypothetical protein